MTGPPGLTKNIAHICEVFPQCIVLCKFRDASSETSNFRYEGRQRRVVTIATHVQARFEGAL